MGKILFSLLLFAIFPAFASAEDIHQRIKKLKNELEILGETEPVFVWGGDPVSIKGNCIKLQSTDVYKAYPKYRDQVYINGKKCETTNTYEADELDDEIIEKESKISTEIIILRKRISDGKSSADKSSLMSFDKKLSELEKEKSELSKARSKYKVELNKYQAKAKKTYDKVEAQMETLRQQLYDEGDIIDAKDTLPDI